MSSDHGKFMALAIEEARTAVRTGERPFGSVIVRDGEVVGRGRNVVNSTGDPTAHAETSAIRDAAANLKIPRLTGCTLYTSCHPCPMCAGAIVQARIPIVIYGTTDPKGGACHTLYQITNDTRLNHRCTVVGGVLKEECKVILQEFFAVQRGLGKK